PPVLGRATLRVMVTYAIGCSTVRWFSDPTEGHLSPSSRHLNYGSLLEFLLPEKGASLIPFFPGSIIIGESKTIEDKNSIYIRREMPGETPGIWQKLMKNII